LAASPLDAAVRLDRAWHSGAAYERYEAMVTAMGGNPNAPLPSAPVRRVVPAPQSGYVASIDTRAVGLVVVELGGGRTRPGMAIDPAVGLSELAFVGELATDRLGVIHAATESQAEAAVRALQAAYSISSVEPTDAQATEPVIERVYSTSHGKG
jgi:thymidine phosphorylase